MEAKKSGRYESKHEDGDLEVLNERLTRDLRKQIRELNIQPVSQTRDEFRDPPPLRAWVEGEFSRHRVMLCAGFDGSVVLHGRGRGSAPRDLRRGARA